VRAGPTSLVDIAPTLLDFLGLPADDMDGRSLL
jgi:arylsulfatase A-like enzyme